MNEASAPAVDPDAVLEQDLALLDRTWAPPKGFFGWFMPVNQRVMGRRYVVTSLVFFVLAGILALLMRTQLAVPDNDFLGPDVYNQFFSVHGTAMMFLFAVPFVEGLGVFVIPPMIGTRDLAFPRLSAFSYYVFLIGGVVLTLSVFLGAAPDAGWFNYVPLASKPYSDSHRIDVYATVVTFIEVSALAAAVELIVTILKQRAPGMSLNRLPPFGWTILVTALMIVFAMPGVIVATVLLALDRLVGTTVFHPAAGGDPVLWQHLFWWFGHPEVYIVFLPATGVVSTVIPVFSRRPLFGYTAVVLSVVATGLLSFGLWVHHMFTIGLPVHADSFFTAASVMIAIPTGVQMFAWIATLWSGRPQFSTALLFSIGFILLMVLGGLTGVMVATVPFDEQVHDTYFVVAHFHYVLIGGAVFPIFSGLFFWWPKLAGRLLSERLGKLCFWLMFVGFNVAFFPMHILGFQGMPRRVYTYPAELGWGDLNMLATVGAYVFGLGVAVFIVNVIWTALRGERAGPNPWNASTLEWLTESPPRNYNFEHLPVVRGRDPLWELAEHEPRPVVTGLRADRREILVSSVLTGQAEAVVELPGPTPWPFLLAATSAIGFVGSIFHPAWFVAGFFLAFFAMVGWFWPRRPWRRGG